MAGHRRRPTRQGAVAVLALTALLGAGGCSTADPGAPGVTAAPSGSTPAAAPTGAGPGPTGSASPLEAARGAATALAGRRTAALGARDRSAWLATVDGAEGNGFAADQGALFDRMTALPLDRLSVRGVDLEPTDGGWAAHLHLAYGFAGYDLGVRDYTVSYRLSDTPEGWRFTGTAPGQDQPQPFDLPGMAVVSSPDTLVIGDQPTSALEAYRALGDAAHARIAAVWGEARPAVVVAPSSLDQLRRVLGRPADAAFDQVAALTDGPLTSGSPAPSDRVYLNPEQYARLSATGRGVVVTHELTHATVRSTTTASVPTWLSEGFADFVAFGATDLPASRVAADVLDEVRAGTGPTALPDEAAFDPARSTIAPAYSAAWLAVRLLAQQHGQDRLVAFYRAVATPAAGSAAAAASPDQRAQDAFGSVLGTTQDAVTTAWLAELRTLAG